MKNYLVVLTNYGELFSGDDNEFIYLTVFAPDAKAADKMGDVAAEHVKRQDADVTKDWTAVVIGPLQ